MFYIFVLYFLHFVHFTFACWIQKYNIMFNWINVLELFPRERKIEKQILPKIPYEEVQICFVWWFGLASGREFEVDCGMTGLWKVLISSWILEGLVKLLEGILNWLKEKLLEFYMIFPRLTSTSNFNGESAARSTSCNTKRKTKPENP